MARHHRHGEQSAAPESVPVSEAIAMKRTTLGLFLLRLCACARRTARKQRIQYVTGRWDFDRRRFARYCPAVRFFSATRPPSLPSRAEHRRPSVSGDGLWQQLHSPRFYAHGAKPNGGRHFVNQYTLLMDIMLSRPEQRPVASFLQTDPFDHEGTDAEFCGGQHHDTGPRRHRRRRPIQRATGARPPGTASPSPWT